MIINADTIQMINTNLDEIQLTAARAGQKVNPEKELQDIAICVLNVRQQMKQGIFEQENKGEQA